MLLSCNQVFECHLNCGPFFDSSYLIDFPEDPLSTDNITQEQNLGLAELTLLSFDMQLVL